MHHRISCSPPAARATSDGCVSSSMRSACLPSSPPPQLRSPQAVSSGHDFDLVILDMQRGLSKETLASVDSYVSDGFIPSSSRRRARSAFHLPAQGHNAAPSSRTWRAGSGPRTLLLLCGEESAPSDIVTVDNDHQPGTYQVTSTSSRSTSPSWSTRSSRSSPPLPHLLSRETLLLRMGLRYCSTCVDVHIRLPFQNWDRRSPRISSPVRGVRYIDWQQPPSLRRLARAVPVRRGGGAL